MAVTVYGGVTMAVALLALPVATLLTLNCVLLVWKVIVPVAAVAVTPLVWMVPTKEAPRFSVGERMLVLATVARALIRTLSTREIQWSSGPPPTASRKPMVI